MEMQKSEVFDWSGQSPPAGELYLHCYHSPGFEAIRSVWSFSVQREKLWVRIVAEALALKDRQTKTERDRQRQRHKDRDRETGAISHTDAHQVVCDKEQKSV